jgi:predicted nuclease with TOPRIM domain
MGKGDKKVHSKLDDSDDESGSDCDDEFESPSYDELVKLLNKYSKIIIKTRAKCDDLDSENTSLLEKCEALQKASGELRDQNKIMSSKLKELKASKKELKEQYDNLERKHNELNTSYSSLKEEYTTIKVKHDNLNMAYELLFETHDDATNHVVKIDIATSCDDLIDESVEQSSSSKGKKVVVADHYDDYAKIKSENEQLKKDLEQAKATNTVTIENLDHDEELAIENEKLKEENKRLKFEMSCLKQSTNESLLEENKKLKQEKGHLKIGLSKFAKGKSLQSELLMNTVMKTD